MRIIKTEAISNKSLAELIADAFRKSKGYPTYRIIDKSKDKKTFILATDDDFKIILICQFANGKTLVSYAYFTYGGGGDIGGDLYSSFEEFMKDWGGDLR